MSQSDVRPTQAKPQPTPVHSMPARRVRDEVRDGVAVASASLMASVGLVVLAAFLMKLVG